MNLIKPKNPEFWTECQLMESYFNDHPEESMKLMTYHSVVINLYNNERK